MDFQALKTNLKYEYVCILSTRNKIKLLFSLIKTNFVLKTNLKYVCMFVYRNLFITISKINKLVKVVS